MQTKGASINDVHENFGFLDPLPIVTYMITQLISTLVHSSTTPLPPSSVDVIVGSPLRGCLKLALVARGIFALLSMCIIHNFLPQKKGNLRQRI